MKANCLGPLTLFCCLIFCMEIYAQNHDPSKVRLTYESQRWLTQKELAQFDDLFGLSLAVKLRLSNESDRTIYFLSDRNFVRPHGYQMFRKAGQAKWEYLPPSRARDGSPGSEFSGDSYVYLALLPNSTIEFEMFDWSKPNEEHAFSTFVKTETTGVSKEIVSETFQPLTK